MATVTRRGKSYSIRVSCGYDMTGRQIIRKPQPDMTDAQAEKEAQRQAVLFEEKCRTGQVLQGNVRFADFAEIWLRDYAAKQVRPTTFDRYKAMLPRINAAIGHIRLDRLQPHHLMQFYSNLEEAGIREDGKQGRFVANAARPLDHENRICRANGCVARGACQHHAGQECISRKREAHF